MEINNNGASGETAVEQNTDSTIDHITFEEPAKEPVNYFSSTDPFKEKNIKGSALTIPGITESEKAKSITDFTNLIQNNEMGNSRPEWVEESFKKAYENSADALLTPNGIHQDVNIEDYDNVVTYGKEELNTKRATFKKTTASNTNAALFLSMAKNMAGMGTSVQLPLWNSGLWVTLSVPKEIDILHVMEAIANDSIFIGSQTGKFIGTMHDSVYYNTIVEFILDNVISTTVKLEDKTDLINYILISDIQSLITGLVNSMYPDGYAVTRSCKNNFTLKEDGNTLCDFRVTGLVNPSMLILKNNKYVSPEMIVHMAKRTKDSVSTEEVLHYQNTLNTLNVTKVVEFKDNTFDNTYKLTLRIPNIKDYQYMLNIWTNDLESDLTRLLEAGDNINKKREKATKVINANYLTYFLSYIKDIEQINEVTGESISTVDIDSGIKFHTVKGLLELMSPINSIIPDIEIAIKDYINQSSVVIVGLQNYTCPKCKELQVVKTGRDYDNIIPLDMMKLFFVLSQIRVG